jgi:hypothetical protein
MADGSKIVWQGKPDTLGLDLQQIENWRRIGHGRGLKSKHPEQAKGFLFSDLLKKTFPQIKRDDAVLVIAIDGYRSLFSGREILEHTQGQRLLIRHAATEGQGWSVLAAGDFFVDRCVWGVSHVVYIPAAEIQRQIKK